MKRVPCLLLAMTSVGMLPARAETELESLRARCAAQEQRIRELETALGQTRSVSSERKSSTGATHLVQPGDTLDRIAREHRCSVQALIEANRLDASGLIRPGQKLVLPGSSTAKPAATPATISSMASHTVGDGETFAAIARNHGVPLDALLAANPELKPTALRPGQKVKLPSTTSTAKTAPSLGESGTTPVLSESKGSGKPFAAATPQEPAPRVSPTPATEGRIRPVNIESSMTYGEFASLQGTTTKRLNELNGLDLIETAVLAKGSELLAPAQP